MEEITLAHFISLISEDSSNQQLFVEFDNWNGNKLYKQDLADDYRINIRGDNMIWFNRVSDAWELIEDTDENFFSEAVEMFSFARNGKFTIYC